MQIPLSFFLPKSSPLRALCERVFTEDGEAYLTQLVLSGGNVTSETFRRDTDGTVTNCNTSAQGAIIGYQLQVGLEKHFQDHRGWVLPSAEEADDIINPSSAQSTASVDPYQQFAEKIMALGAMPQAHDVAKLARESFGGSL